MWRIKYCQICLTDLAQTWVNVSQQSLLPVAGMPLLKVTSFSSNAASESVWILVHCLGKFTLWNCCNDLVDMLLEVGNGVEMGATDFTLDPSEEPVIRGG